MSLLSHLTTRTPTKSDLHLANSLAAAVNDPDQHIPSAKSHYPFALLTSYQRFSPARGICIRFVTDQFLG